MKFTIAISIEYKDGNISFKKNENLDRAHIDLFEKLVSKQLKQNEDSDTNTTFGDLFIDKYYKEDPNYKFFRSVYNFITGGSIFNLDDLIEELNQLYHIKENTILPQYVIYNSLRSPDYLYLSDTEYKNNVKKLLQFSDSGQFEITDYLHVFHFISRFDNPFKFDLDKLENRIIKGMKKGKMLYKFNRSLDYDLYIHPEAEYKEHLIRIAHAAKDLNSQIDSTQKSVTIEHLEELCYKDYDAFHKELTDKNNSSGFYTPHTPVFHLFNTNKFYHLILKSRNHTRWQIIRLFQNRYQDASTELGLEITFLITIKNRLESKFKALPQAGPTWYTIERMINVLNECISKLTMVNQHFN